ncbi:MAG TPA: hypothetical protein VIG08_05435 [Gemmatimonadales bacterium]|jgi:hypothetical protein
MEPEEPQPAAIAASEDPVQLSVALVEDDRVPEGMVCMGTYRDGKLVARSVVPPEAWDQIQELRIFDEPVQVVLVARAAPPGLQCQLYAMVELTQEGEDDEESSDEPWASSVPRPEFESSGETSDESEGEPTVAPIPLGHIVRFDRDRIHPESLPLEAADVLRKIIDGDTSEVVDRALSDLLGL